MKRIADDTTVVDLAYAERAQLLAQRAAVRDGLMAALEARDGYTEEHSQAVVALALQVGERLELSMEGLREVESVAMLHDIGKLAIPDAILQHPGVLDEQEWAVMRSHVVHGGNIVASLPALAHLAAPIRASHERWDGGGYPDSLSGEDIPVASRIVGVCDAYHAMISHRPYRRPLSARHAHDELGRNAGSQFCPRAVEALLAILGGAAKRAPARRSTR
jgi:HD-GYP domain-containing protein (c-di-GMP phosphodiesterase class II)